jgi:hypothetical protein
MDQARSVTATFADAGGGDGGADDGGDTSVTNHSRSASLALSKHLRASGAVSAGGYGPCQTNATVRIQRKAGGSFKTVKTVSTGSDNKYVTVVPHRTGTYRAQVVAKSPSATHRCLADNSPTRRHTH